MTIKSNISSKIAGSLFVASMFLFFNTSTVSAAWPTENLMGLAGTNLGGALSAVEQKTRSIILARMQQEAIKQIQDTMGDLITGGNGHGSYVITSYEDFIYGTSHRAGEQMMTDFFKTAKQGVTEEEKDVLRLVEARVKEDLFSGPPKQTLGQFVENEEGEKTTAPITDMFDGNSLDAWVEFETGAFNKPSKMVAYTEAMLRNYMNKRQDIQRTKAIANQGFNPQNGIPGSVISQLVANAESAPIEMISNATSAEQVITSLATSTMTSFMRTGYASTAMPAMNRIQKIEQKYDGGVEYIQSLIYEGQE
jgi:hypothetical protein